MLRYWCTPVSRPGIDNNNPHTSLKLSASCFAPAGLHVSATVSPRPSLLTRWSCRRLAAEGGHELEAEDIRGRRGFQEGSGPSIRCGKLEVHGHWRRLGCTRRQWHRCRSCQSTCFLGPRAPLAQQASDEICSSPRWMLLLVALIQRAYRLHPSLLSRVRLF